MPRMSKRGKHELSFINDKTSCVEKDNYLGGTIVQTVKVWIQRMMKISQSLVFATHGIRSIWMFAGDEECTEAR